MKKTRVEKTDQEWKEVLPDDVYSICRLAGTEPAFTGKYWDHKEVGVYNCACCGAALFKSETKYDSGSGWPSFFVPVADDRIRIQQDESHGMVREEVLCAVCDAHLGHVFPDGPPPTGLRYCINSASLQFEPAVESFTY